MKRGILCIVCTLMVLSVFSQRTTPNSRAAAARAAEREEMLRQSGRKRTAAIIMVSAGSTMVVGGVVMMVAGAVEDWDAYSGTYDSNDGLVVAGAITSVAGLGLALGSIPVFIHSHRLRKEARFSFSPLNIKMPVSGNQVVRIPQMQVSFKVPLGR